MRYKSGGPYYFETFDAYHIPFRPINEITLDKAKSQNAYCVAYFDSSGKILSFTKFLNGKFEFGDKYVYNSKGLLERREVAKYTGETIIQYLDKNENLLRKDTTQTDSVMIIRHINNKEEIFEVHIFRKGT